MNRVFRNTTAITVTCFNCKHSFPSIDGYSHHVKTELKSNLIMPVVPIEYLELIQGEDEEDKD